MNEKLYRQVLEAIDEAVACGGHVAIERQAGDDTSKLRATGARWQEGGALLVERLEGEREKDLSAEELRFFFDARRPEFVDLLVGTEGSYWRSALGNVYADTLGDVVLSPR